ncbi:hypothetical protein S40288_10033 [Stachybotrys chartarum IBT 40288]|nr:hypothetical protein S40288_10033 [Stachybotrys chartarum IBT 40288]
MRTGAVSGSPVLAPEREPYTSFILSRMHSSERRLSSMYLAPNINRNASTFWSLFSCGPAFPSTSRYHGCRPNTRSVLMAHEAYSAQNFDDLRTLSEQYGVTVISQLDRKELALSASRWGIRHLIVYRTIHMPEESFLSTLKADHNAQCPICKKGQQQELNDAEASAFTGDNPTKFKQVSDSELLRKRCGPFWVALAQASRTGRVDEKEYPQRDRKQVVLEHFTSTESAVLGSSSPTAHTPSEFEANMSGFDEDQNEARRSIPEEVTVQLIISFLRQALNLCLLQRSNGITEVRPRVERIMTSTIVAGKVPISAEDDGGICLMELNMDQWIMKNPYIAILEAKRASMRVHYDEKTETVRPIESSETLAQKVGEAVIAWKENQELLKDGVFLIAATNTFVRFVHFEFGSDYLEYLDAADEKTQMEIINDPSKNATITIRNTRWLNLEMRDERRTALCHVLGLLRQNDRASHYANSRDESDEESDEYAEESDEEMDSE